MSRAGGVYGIDPRNGMIPVCYFATHHYYVRYVPVFCSPNFPKRNAAIAYSAFGTWTVLVTGALELIAIRIAL
jgi:hypothetical protein